MTGVERGLFAVAAVIGALIGVSLHVGARDVLVGVGVVWIAVCAVAALVGLVALLAPGGLVGGWLVEDEEVES